MVCMSERNCSSKEETRVLRVAISAPIPVEFSTMICPRYNTPSYQPAGNSSTERPARTIRKPMTANVATFSTTRHPFR
jgi:hypothetical protein